jgi:SAM-dependent methyltransferase
MPIMNKDSFRNDRLYPPIHDVCYHILNLLRININEIKGKYVKQGSVIVDVGCGSKPYISIFEPLNVKYIGVDLAENKLADLFIGPNNTIPLQDCYADLVLSTQVLEHIEEPLKYLSECRRILKTDGVLVLSTHGYWSYHPSPEDYWRWTRSGLRTLFKEAHFEIIESRGLMGIVPSAVQLFLIGVLNRIPTSLLKKIFVSIFQSFIVILDKLSSKVATDRDACVFLIIARK